MIEPEMAFADIEDDIELAQSYLKFIYKEVLDTCAEDMEFFDRFVSPGVLQRLQKVVEAPLKSSLTLMPLQSSINRPKNLNSPSPGDVISSQNMNATCAKSTSKNR